LSHVVGERFGGRCESTAGVDGDDLPVHARMLVELAVRSFPSLLPRAVVNPSRRMRDQTRRHRDVVQRTAVEEGDLVVVDVAVVPGRAFGAGDAFGGGHCRR
jgi:hypothetical protein